MDLTPDTAFAAAYEFLKGHWRGLSSPREYSCPWYFLSALVIAFAFVMIRKRCGLRAAAAEVFRRDIWLGRSARADYGIMVINELLLRVPNAVAFLAIFNGIALAVPRLIGPVTPLIGAGVSRGLGTAIYTLFILAMLDLGSYATHKMQHEIPFFWRFHAMHHAAETMTPFTVFRQHPLDMAHYTLFRGIAAGLGAALFTLVWPVTDTIILIGGANAALVLYYVTAGLRHSHVPLAFPKALRPIFLSPHMHQLHHSRDPRHFQCNYGVVFAFWDRLFGSYIDEDAADIAFGLGDQAEQSHHSVLRLYLEPLGFRFGQPAKAAAPEPAADEKAAS
jgi:sterol desaturase/sphingolipid hydroxylase (fatty acid hydroxylase superfamily)